MGKNVEQTPETLPVGAKFWFGKKSTLYRINALCSSLKVSGDRGAFTSTPPLYPGSQSTRIRQYPNGFKVNIDLIHIVNDKQPKMYNS